MKLFSLSLLVLFLVVLFSGCVSTPVKERKHYYIHLPKEFLQNLDFSEHDVVAKLIGDSWYYIRKDGKAISVMRGDDGGADRFKEGLARIKIKGKIGFFNKTLDMILNPIYDFAFPFHNGIAEVCIGCREIIENGHSLLDGGSWKRIDRAGLILEE